MFKKRKGNVKEKKKETIKLEEGMQELVKKTENLSSSYIHVMESYKSPERWSLAFHMLL